VGGLRSRAGRPPALPDLARRPSSTSSLVVFSQNEVLDDAEKPLASFSCFFSVGNPPARLEHSSAAGSAPWLADRALASLGPTWYWRARERSLPRSHRHREASSVEVVAVLATPKKRLVKRGERCCHRVPGTCASDGEPWRAFELAAGEDVVWRRRTRRGCPPGSLLAIETISSCVAPGLPDEISLEIGESMVRECTSARRSSGHGVGIFEQTHAGYSFSMRRRPGEQVAES